MDRYSSLELLRAFSSALRKELPVEAGIPLNVKLPLERLRLVELLAEARRRESSRATPETSTPGRCICAAR